MECSYLGSHYEVIRVTVSVGVDPVMVHSEVVSQFMSDDERACSKRPGEVRSEGQS